MLGFIVLLHVVGFGVLFTLVVPKHYHLGGDHPVFGIGVGVLAYSLGLRHAFDADHIAAVDNATRKLMADNVVHEATGQRVHRRSPAAGFWFSLGHSSVVFALAFLLSVGVKSLADPVTKDDSSLHDVTGLIGASVSGVSSGYSEFSTSSYCSASCESFARCAPVSTARPKSKNNSTSAAS
jgi:high-affinity nickel-transport protein